MENELGAVEVLAGWRRQRLDNETARTPNNSIKSKKEITNSNESRDYKPPAIPPVPSLRGLIGNCSKPLEKLLTITDLTPKQHRLLLKKGDVEECLTTMLNKDEKLNLKGGIAVTTYDMEGKQYPMVFKLRKSYVLTCGWTAFLQKHKLTAEEDLVTIWMFRHVQTRKLCFVIGSRKAKD